jgi:nitroreductase
MDTVPTEIIEKAVHTAGRAPSLHNSQPWRWVFTGEQLHLYAVPERLLPATDPTGRQMTISCGIALGHLRTTLAAEGWRTFVAYLPDPNRRTHLVTIRFAPRSTVTDADRELARAIPRRRTDRLPLRPPTGWDEFETVLRTTFDPDDALLDIVPDDRRAALAQASELTAALRHRDADYQSELMWWTATGGDVGVPRSALLSPAERVQVPIGRSFPVIRDMPRRGPMPDQATVLVLSTDSDDRLEVLRCGEVLSTVLLECTAAGYATCVLTHLTEYPRSRAIVADLVGDHALPQALVRVGMAPDSSGEPPTPRLPLDAILRIAR